MKIENQDRIILAFLEKVAQQLEKETGIKGWECLVDDEDTIGDEDTGVYMIGNDSLKPSLIVEVNVKPKIEPKKISVSLYHDNSVLLKSIKEELPKVAKKLKIDDWEINW